MKASDRTLAKRYARAYMALDGVAFDKHAQAAAKARIEALEKIRNHMSQYRRVFLHPLAGYEDKNEVLARLVPEAELSGPAAIFIQLLLKEKRFYLLETIIEDCMHIFNSHAGIIRAEVISRHPLGEGEVEHIGKMLSSAAQKKVLVSHIISERVIGGIEIKMGDLVIDATIKGKLEKLKRKIIAF